MNNRAIRNRAVRNMFAGTLLHAGLYMGVIGMMSGCSSGSVIDHAPNRTVVAPGAGGKFDIGSGTKKIGKLSCGESITGSIQYDFEYHAITLPLKANQQIGLQLSRTTSNSDDPDRIGAFIYYLLSPAQDVLVRVDNGGYDTGVLKMEDPYAVKEAGNYMVVVGSYYHTGLGDYTLTLTCSASPDEGSTDALKLTEKTPSEKLRAVFDNFESEYEYRTIYKYQWNWANGGSGQPELIDFAHAVVGSYYVDILKDDWAYLGFVDLNSNENDPVEGYVGRSYMEKQLSYFDLNYEAIEAAAQLKTKPYQVGVVTYTAECQASVNCKGHFFIIAPYQSKTLYVVDIGYADE